MELSVLWWTQLQQIIRLAVQPEKRRTMLHLLLPFGGMTMDMRYLKGIPSGTLKDGLTTILGHKDHLKETKMF